MTMTTHKTQYITHFFFRHEEANRTALEAIGGPKKRKFGDIEAGTSSSTMGSPPLPVKIQILFEE